MSEHTPLNETPSRSARRRAALDVLELANQLVALPSKQRQSLALPDAINDAVTATTRIKSHVARKRQLGFLAKLLRAQDADFIAALQAQLAAHSPSHQQNIAMDQRLQQMADALIADDGDGDVLYGLIEANPALDRQHLRSLMRQARREAKADKPRQARRQILHFLRQLPHV